MVIKLIQLQLCGMKRSAPSAPLLEDWLAKKESAGPRGEADVLRMGLARWALGGYEEPAMEWALRVFDFQSRANPVYRRFLELLAVGRNAVHGISDIPFLPVEAFKVHDVLAVEAVDQWFRSSGTTMGETSRHGVDDLGWYHAWARLGFERRFGSLSDWEVFSLLPGYVERPDASLLSMVCSWMPEGGLGRSGLGNHRAWEARMLAVLADSSRKLLLVGVTHGLLDWLESGIPASFLEATSGRLHVMETGGMKGRRQELTRSEVHERLREVLGAVPVYSEYGMTEMLSQAYCSDGQMFFFPPSLLASIGEVDDPLGESEIGRSGRLRWMDLGNVHSCSFIATGDLGRLDSASGGVQIIGRFDHAEVRGCNLMVI